MLNQVEALLPDAICNPVDEDNPLIMICSPDLKVVGYLCHDHENNGCFFVSDCGDLLVQLTNDGYFPPERLQHDADKVRARAQDGMILRIDEYVARIRTTEFPLEGLPKFWKAYRAEYSRIIDEYAIER